VTRRTHQIVSTLTLGLLVAAGCGGLEDEAEGPPEGIERSSSGFSSIDCTQTKATGYVQGQPFSITVVTVDGKKMEVGTANAYYVMAQAAAKAGVNLKVVSGFRTMAEQTYLYNCHINCNCNNCNLAAKPGYSNHQSGHAVDLNTSASGVYSWLSSHAGTYGFKRTVPSEAWHWEWWGGGPGGGPCGKPAYSCDHRVGVFGWSCDGKISGMSCLQITEPADPDTWKDNYFCSARNFGFKWSHKGAIAGMRCTKVHESADPDTWNDNYLCVPEVSPFRFKWSSAGPIANMNCLKWDEPADKSTWNDNYLCWDRSALQKRGPFAWSSKGPVAGMTCTQIVEPADPDTWKDNYFCATSDLGMRWSSNGPIAGLRCTKIAEGADPHTWKDNYLCVPTSSPYTFRWSSAGPLDPHDCIAWYEPADPDTWDDNYLCW
jgi:hypothetical protein